MGDEKGKNKLKEATNNFLKIVHELKSPIHGIQGVSDYLIDNWDSLSEKNKKDSINIIVDAGYQLLELSQVVSHDINQTLGIKYNFVKVDLVKYTQNIVEKFEKIYLLKSNILIKFNSEIEKFIADCDTLWYKQLLTNLLSNALDHSGAENISVNVKLAVNDKEELVVSVSDDGIGIEESKLATIFDLYNKGEKNSSPSKQSEIGGHGIGLSLCREIVLAHGGNIQAKPNNLGHDLKGVTFEFSIPKTII